MTSRRRSENFSILIQVFLVVGLYPKADEWVSLVFPESIKNNRM